MHDHQNLKFSRVTVLHDFLCWGWKFSRQIS